MRSTFKLPIDVQSMHFPQGSQEAVSAAPPEIIQSYVWFVAPVNTDVINPGSYEVDSETGTVTVRFYRVENEQDDAIFQDTKQLVLVADENGKPFVPTRYLTDNRGTTPVQRSKFVFRLC